jgi:hypothetical protein
MLSNIYILVTHQIYTLVLTAEKYLTQDRTRNALHYSCNDVSAEYSENRKTYLRNAEPRHSLVTVQAILCSDVLHAPLKNVFNETSDYSSD